MASGVSHLVGAVVVVLAAGVYINDYYNQPLWRRNGLKPVVMGMAYGYGWDDLRPFVVSLRDTGYTGDCILFISDESERNDAYLINRLERWNVTYVPITQKWPFLEEYIEEPSILKMIPSDMFPFVTTKKDAGVGGYYPGAILHSLRYYLAATWFEAFQEEDRYTHALLADTRDVIFQLDPFDWPIGDKLHAAVEISRFPVGKCEFNQRFLAPLGEEIVNDLSENIPVCSGTTFGSLRMIQEYLKRMTKITRNYWNMVIKLEGAPGHDQGFHTYLMYKSEWPEDSLELMPNGEGQVRTVAAEYGRKIVVPKDEVSDLVLNDDMSPVRVLHQWDRDGVLTAAIKAKYWWIDSNS